MSNGKCGCSKHSGFIMRYTPLQYPRPFYKEKVTKVLFSNLILNTQFWNHINFGLWTMFFKQFFIGISKVDVSVSFCQLFFKTSLVCLQWNMACLALLALHFSEGISSRIRALCATAAPLACSSALLLYFTTRPLPSSKVTTLRASAPITGGACEVSQITIWWRGILKSFIDSSTIILMKHS